MTVGYCCLGIFFITSKKVSMVGRKFIFYLIPFVSFLPIIFWIVLTQYNQVLYLMIIGMFYIFYFAFIWYLLGELTTERIVLLLAAAGFLLRLGYTLYTGIEERQHDVNTFGSKGIGHAGYIEYFYYYWRLPDFDPRIVWQFYHPPLHHFIAALWLQCLTLLGMGWERATESIQMLTLFYSSCCMIISYRIFKVLNLKKAGLIVAFAVVCAHPTFFILAGSINNDILSIAFALGAILSTNYWYKNPTAGNILKIALCIGLGTMTKFSVVILAPAIALVFLIKLIGQRKEELWSYIKQFVAFGSVSIPLGFWWSMRNYVLYKVPFTYVPRLSERSKQYVGFHPPLERLFGFSLKQFNSVFIAKGGADGYYEYNPLIALLKSSMFGDWKLNVQLPGFFVGCLALSNILFYTNAILIFIALVAMIYFLLKKNDYLDVTMKCFFATLFCVILGSYLKFSFDFPHKCTQNIRYVTPLIVVGALFIGILVQTLGNSNRRSMRIVKYGIIMLVGIWFASSALLYIFLAN